MLSIRRLCFLMFLMETSDAMLSLCGTPSGYLEVQVGKQDNTFTCLGQLSGMSVQWQLEYPDATVTNIGTCYPNTTCTCRLSKFFTIRRTADSATLIVNETTITPKDILFTTNVQCQTFSGRTIINEAKCPLDLISPPETSSCSLQIRNTTWTLTGQCDVSKVQSARGRYYCLLYQNSQPSSTQLGKFTMSTSSIVNTNYSNGICQIDMSLPPEGNFTYTVVIVPGEVRVSPSFTGSYEIRSPTETPTHDCPQYIQENLPLRCYCYANDLGAPSGSVVWNNVSSSKLVIESVNRTISGMNFTCILMWNNTAVRTATYSPIVNYSSSVLSFKMADTEASAVEVRENENVSVSCKADGRPLPTIRLLKVSDGDSQTVAEANNARDLVHTLAQVQCESAATYVCQSENIVKGDERRTSLTVTCAPRENSTNGSDTHTATFKGEEAMLEFQMISRPAPNALSIIYIGPLPNDTTNHNRGQINASQFKCSLLKMYVATCSVTLQKKANFTVGFYSAVFGNGLGNLSFTFEIKEDSDLTTSATETTGQPPQGNTRAIVGGVLGAVVAVIVIVVLIIFIIRRKGWSEKGGDVSAKPERQALGERQISDDNAENKDVYATVVKNSKQTSPSLTKLTPSQTTGAETTPHGKPKVTKARGKGTKKREGDKQPLAQEDTGFKGEGGLLSMTPMTGSEYANFGFDETGGKERKADKQTQRRNQEDLNYTTVIFSNTANTPTPLPQLESTEYACIVPLKKPRE